MFGCARVILSLVNNNTTTTLAQDVYAVLSDIDHLAMQKFFDDMAAAFVAEEDAWERTFQYGADVGLDVGPAV